MDGRDVGTDPIEITILRAVFDNAHPGFALLDGVPHVNEYPGRHVGVSNQVMGLAHQFVVGETADGNKGLIAVGDPAIEIGRGDQSLFGGKYSFMLGYGQIHAHTMRPLGLLL
ncbi:hypothetical protein D3C87_1671430 [compost metagenome]